MNIKPVSIQDTDRLKNIFIQIDIKTGKVVIVSNFFAWENLSYLMEALGTTATICEEEGVSKKEIRQAINNYLDNLFSSAILARKRKI